MQRVEDDAVPASTPPQHGRPGDMVALPLRDPHEPHRHPPVQTTTVAFSVSYVLRLPWHDIRDSLLHQRDSTATGKAASRGDARAGMPRLLVRPDARPDGHRHAQTTVRGPAPPPRAGALSAPPPIPVDDTPRREPHPERPTRRVGAAAQLDAPRDRLVLLRRLSWSRDTLSPMDTHAALRTLTVAGASELATRDTLDRLRDLQRADLSPLDARPTGVSPVRCSRRNSRSSRGVVTILVPPGLTSTN